MLTNIIKKYYVAINIKVDLKSAATKQICKLFFLLINNYFCIFISISTKFKSLLE